MLRGIAFTPPRLQVDAGTKVTWDNEDDIAHTVTSGKAPVQGVPGLTEDKTGTPNGMFDEELTHADAEFEFTFKKAGTYAYYCDIHAGMKGVIEVL